MSDSYCDGCGRELCMCPPALYTEYFAPESSSPYTLAALRFFTDVRGKRHYW